VLVAVLQIEGSTPRGDDAKMLITTEDSYDSIGRGQLGFQAIELARELLSTPKR